MRCSREVPGRGSHLRRLLTTRGRATLSALTAAILLPGCGGAASPAARLCGPATAVVARSLSVAVRRVRVRETRDFAELRYCHYSVAGGGGRPAVHALVTVDTTPQPLWRLNRTEAEYAQGFGTPNGRPLDPPAHLDGLGIDADWLPVEQEVMATDRVRLITVAPVWPGAGIARRRAFAESIAREFLSGHRPSA